MEMAEVLIIRGVEFMNKKLSAILRAVGALGAVTAIVGGVTFAALNSQATLTQSTITSANASLLVWDGDSFESTAPGFTITGLVPGSGSGEKPFYLRNNGGVALNVSARIPTLPSSSGFSGWANVKVTITGNSPTCTGTNPVITNMAALNAGDVALPCNPLSVNAQGNSGVLATEGNYSFNFDVLPSSITGSQVTIGAFDINFNGVQ